MSLVKYKKNMRENLGGKYEKELVLWQNGHGGLSYPMVLKTTSGMSVKESYIFVFFPEIKWSLS